jgi:serine/threonine-protein kinase
MSSLPSFEGCDAVEKVEIGPVVEVYRATQAPLGRRVTIKALAPNIVPESPFAGALEREARLLAQLSHPNLIGLYDFVRRGDRLWLVLEYVEGWTLAEILRRMKVLPQAAAAAVARAIAEGLAHAHERGIVHRDIRPSNVLVSKTGEVKLTDFGVASDERLPTAPEILDGSGQQPSLAYASPELVLGEAPDPRSDLFTLGALLYELVAGKTPFGAADDPEATVRIRNEPPPPLGRFVPELAPALERVVQRCLQKLPAHRYQTAGELVQALDAALAELNAEPRGALLLALSSGGFGVKGAPRPSEVAITRPAAQGVHHIALVLACFLVLMATGGFVIELLARRSGKADAEPGNLGRLELVPKAPGYLRVVVQPWANVIVDGEAFDTTPFARPIPLTPGTHYVRLEHPQAPTERRTIELVAGETILLDVTMKVRRPAGLSQGPFAAPPNAAPADSSP